MTLATIAFIMGFIIAVLSLMLLIVPDTVMNIIQKFPRSRVPAWILTAVDLTWSAILLWNMPMERFDVYKPLLYVLTPVIFIMTVFLMDELLAPRALGGLLLLIASPVLTVARQHDSPWRVLIPSITYLLILYGMLLVMNPYYFRKAGLFLLHNKFRRISAAVTGLILAFMLTVLSLTVY